MRAYKLVRKLRDGSLSPLFINKSSRLPTGKWLKSESHPTKGYAFRPGWHCVLEPVAPHLSEKGRVWVEVDVRSVTFHDRPQKQGGRWAIAKQMKIIREL